MKLTNCFYGVEKMLQEIELTGLGNEELIELARIIKDGWDVGTFEDENIIIDALVQIAEELGRRMK